MPDSLPLVSICIGVYNREQFLEKNLKSILSQTYSNLEIIISDNASTDRSVEIINSILSSATIPHEVYVQEKNLGPDENYRFLANKAKGEFIALFHSDDVYSPTIIEESINLFMNNSNENVGIIMAQSSESINIPKKKLYPIKTDDCFVIDYKNYISYLANKRANILNCPTAIWSRTALLSMEHENRYPDSNDLLEYLKILKKGYVIFLNDKVLHYYTRHAGQDSSMQKKVFNFTYPGIYKTTRDFICQDKIRNLYPPLFKYWLIETVKLIYRKISSK